jgi:hypothetical protein
MYLRGKGVSFLNVFLKVFIYKDKAPKYIFGDLLGRIIQAERI